MNEIRKYKNVILIFVIMIIIVNIMNSSSMAFNIKNYSPCDESYAFSYNDTSAHFKEGTYNPDGGADNNLFCAEHGDKLRSVDRPYRLVDKITIKGNNAKSFYGNEIKNKLTNGRIAYAIHNAENNHERQKIIWYWLDNWMTNVGKLKDKKGKYIFDHLDGFTVKSGGIAYKNLSKDSKEVIADAKSYADDIDNNNNTSTTAKITQKNKDKVNVTIEGYHYKIGPINLEFNPKLSSIYVENQNGETLEEDQYCFLQNGVEISNENVGQIESKKDFYLLVNRSNMTNIKITARTKKPKGTTIDATIAFFKSSGESWQNLVMVETKSNTFSSKAASVEISVPLTGSLQIEKVDADNSNFKMANVGFKVQNVDTGGWVKADSSLGSFEEAKTFMTGADGKTEVIPNLQIGNYKPVETVNPYSGYIDTNPDLTQYVSAGTTQNVTVASKTNKHEYTSISGYVWVDGEVGKTTSMNGTFDTEEGKNGIRVGLWDHRGDILVDEMDTKTTIDSNGQTINGKYQFDNVKVDDLAYLYVDFYYDGITYATVNPNPSAYQYNADGTKVFIDAGTKAVENSGLRENLNNKFGNITNNYMSQNSIKINDGVTNDILGYSRDTANHKSTVSYAGIDTTVWARAGANPEAFKGDSAGLSLCNDFSLTGRFEEIKAVDPFVANGIENVNLGLKVREKPNMSVLKDIERVKLSINGYNHIYNYDTRYQKYGNNPGGLNVGVKFGNEYGSMAYTRPIYKSDYTYENPKDRSKELQVYITYKIMIYNNTTTLYERN